MKRGLRVLNPLSSEILMIDNDNSSTNSTNQQKKSQKSKTRMCIKLFCSCTKKFETKEHKNYTYLEGSMEEQVKILSSSECLIAGSTQNCWLRPKRLLGMIDSTIYRRIYIDTNKYTLEGNS